MEPLSLGLLAGMTPPGVECRLFDDRINEIDYDEPTDLVAINIETFTARRAYEIAAEYRAQPGAGGDGAACMPRSYLMRWLNMPMPFILATESRSGLRWSPMPMADACVRVYHGSFGGAAIEGKTSP